MTDAFCSRPAWFTSAGTFTQMALRRGRRKPTPRHTLQCGRDALAAASVGAHHARMVLIENSVEGGVSATSTTSRPATRSSSWEVLVPITFVLAARPRGDARGRHGGGAPASHAWAQVRGWESEPARCHMCRPVDGVVSDGAGRR